MATKKEIEDGAVNTIRILSAETVEKAASGHPGMPMGMADVGFTLWARYLKHTPAAPQWPDRDRFVLSAGHGSTLLYSLLHLCGYDLSLDDLKNFRQWRSKTPGHPEYGHTPGVETTTGPLGQGFANAVGMALTERMLASRFNTEAFSIIDHYTYAISGDGCMMEGVTSEAASLAGHLGLGKLIVFYDDNQITIEGKTDLAFSEDVAARFEAYGWQVLKTDAHDRSRVERMIEDAQRETEKPTIIICKGHIAYGSPNKQDTHGAHGAPLGAEELRLTKEKLGLPADKEFFVSDEVRDLFKTLEKEWEKRYTEWKALFEAYRKKEPEKAQAFQQYISGGVPEGLLNEMPAFEAGQGIATRASSGKVINALSAKIVNLVGGSADLAPSNKTEIDHGGHVNRGDFSGRNLHFGVREHAMGSLLNGIALHGGFIPYGGTFLVFSDYMRPAIRLAAMMKQRVVYVFTHDSIFVGEDGPTHQPVEQLAALRSIPNLDVIRPAEATETFYAWLHAVQRTDGPTALCLSRQKLPTFEGTSDAPAGAGLMRGAYVLNEDPGPWDWVLIGSGSEAHVCVEAAQILRGRGARIRVVSMPSWELFLRQDEAYRNSVIPPDAKTAVAETGIRMGWERFAGQDAVFLTQDDFGTSAPYPVLAEKLGFTAERLAEKLSM